MNAAWVDYEGGVIVTHMTTGDTLVRDKAGNSRLLTGRLTMDDCQRFFWDKDQMRIAWRAAIYVFVEDDAGPYDGWVSMKADWESRYGDDFDSSLIKEFDYGDHFIAVHTGGRMSSTSGMKDSAIRLII